MNFFFSKTFLKTSMAFYMWLLGLCIGSIFASGAFSASVIFNANDFGVDISKFESGILMTAIFSKLNTLLLFSAFVIVFYEIISFRLGSGGRINKILLFLSASISVICILLFSLYYSPYIIETQKLGESAIASSEFASMHTQSKVVFYILFFTLSFNFIYRILYSKEN